MPNQSTVKQIIKQLNERSSLIVYEPELGELCLGLLGNALSVLADEGVTITIEPGGCPYEAVLDRLVAAKGTK